MTDVDPVRHAYRGAGQRWERDAELMYLPLAEHLVARSPDPWPGLLVLDAGAGGGAVGHVLSKLHADAVAVDLEPSMLTDARPGRSRRVAADVTMLPLRDGAVDATVAAFVLNHLGRPELALAEFGRVTRPGGVVLASAFAAESPPAKEVVDTVLQSFGWQPPEWHGQVKERAATIETVQTFAEAARRAGLVDITVVPDRPDVGLEDPDDIVRHRLGMAHAGPFVDRLTVERRHALVATAVSAVSQLGEPYEPSILELVARAP